MEEDLWKIYDTNKEWVKFAESKAIGFIVIIGVVLNIFFNNIKDDFMCLSNYNIFKWLYLISLIFFLISLFCLIYCLIPKNTKTGSEKRNVIYYKSINDNFKNENDYYHHAINHSEDFKENLCTQIYQLAKVATNKYSIVKLALISFLFGIIILILSFIFRGFYHV